MWTISKEFSFSASHSLDGLPSEHPCSKLHGHNYVVRCFFKNAVTNNIGFVIDYRNLEKIKDYINNELDHKHLNDVFDFNPTAENIAKYLFEKIKALGYWQLNAIEVSETPKTNCRYEPPVN